MVIQKKSQKKIDEIELVKKERKVEQEERELHFASTFNSTIIGALTFVAGLFWRDVATEFVKILLPQWEGLLGTIFTAVIVTTFFVLIIMRMNKNINYLERRLERHEKELDDLRME
jgi:hypothetical protein